MRPREVFSIFDWRISPQFSSSLKKHFCLRKVLLISSAPFEDRLLLRLKWMMSRSKPMHSEYQRISKSPCYRKLSRAKDPSSLRFLINKECECECSFAFS